MIFQTTFRLAFRTHTAATTILEGNRHRLRANVQVNTRDIPRLVQPQQQPVMCLQTVHAQIPFLNAILNFFETQSNQRHATKFLEEPLFFSYWPELTACTVALCNAKRRGSTLAQECLIS